MMKDFLPSLFLDSWPWHLVLLASNMMENKQLWLLSLSYPRHHEWRCYSRLGPHPRTDSNGPALLPISCGAKHRPGPSSLESSGSLHAPHPQPTMQLCCPAHRHTGLSLFHALVMLFLCVYFHLLSSCWKMQLSFHIHIRRDIIIIMYIYIPWFPYFHYTTL